MREQQCPLIGSMVELTGEHWLRFGDVLIQPDPSNPKKVWMRHVTRGDGGQFDAQDLVDLVTDYYARMF